MKIFDIFSPMAISNDFHRESERQRTAIRLSQNFYVIKIFDSMKLNMKITTNIRYEHLVDYQAFKQQRVGKNAHPLPSKILIYNNLRKRRSLNDSLLKHSLSYLHEAGDVGTLDIVDVTVRLSSVFHASLVNV